MSQKEILKERMNDVLEKSKTLPDNIIYKDGFNQEILEKEVDKDLKIDRERLSECQQKAPVYMHRYLRILQDFIRKLNFYKRIYDELYSLKYEWFKIYYDFTVEKKTEVEIYVKGDIDILKIKESIENCSEIIEYLKNICDRFSNRSYEINNIISWEKFKHGE